MRFLGIQPLDVPLRTCVRQLRRQGLGDMGRTPATGAARVEARPERGLGRLG